MPELTEKGHILEIGPEKLWEKYLPIVKKPRSVLGHLHQKTYFKSTHAFCTQDGIKNVDLTDNEVSDLIRKI